MNETMVLNFALIGIFILMLCVYIFTVHYSSNIIGNIPMTTTVAAFCG